MASHIWGDDAEAMMRDFHPSDALLMKYENMIVDCEKAIRGHRVLDMGCGHGLWSYMSLRHGASHVVGIEPRGMFVQGLNSFADQHGLSMQFHRGYDTDLPRLLREHDIDTALLSHVDDITNWEVMMRDLRKSSVKWVILQVTALPDTWIEFNKEIFDYAQSGAGMPVGFTLHYEIHNSTTRSGINPLLRDQADPETGFQHIDTKGNFDLNSSRLLSNKRSRQYTRNVIDHNGFVVDSSKIQTDIIPNSPGRGMSHGLVQWYLLRNDK